MQETLKIKVRTNKNNFQYEATIENATGYYNHRKTHPITGRGKSRPEAILNCLENNDIICTKF